MTKINAVELPPKIYNIKGWINQTNPIELKKSFDHTLIKSGFNVLNYTDQEFPLNGFTAFWLLAESHLAVHTFSKSGWSYIELSSCNKEKAVNFINLCKQSSVSYQWENEVEELSCETELTIH
nr:S-adenosylmethionine decarboxylase [uncultured Carboxylicivirga sp.]